MQNSCDVCKIYRILEKNTFLFNVERERYLANEFWDIEENLFKKDNNILANLDLSAHKKTPEYQKDKFPLRLLLF